MSIIPTPQTQIVVLDYASEIERDPHLKSPHTRRQYRTVLEKFEAWRGGRLLTLTLVEEYAAELQKAGKSFSTINQALATIRWWARRVITIADELLDPDQISMVEDGAQSGEVLKLAQRAARLAEKATTVGNVKGKRAPKGRHLEPDELEALLKACTDDPSPIGARDAALIALAWVTGARNEEIRNLTLDDLHYTEEGADLLIQHGKGDKARTVFLFGGALEAVNAWIEVRGAERGYLFNPIRKNGNIATTRQLTYIGSKWILRERFQQSSLTEAMNWHDFRRTLVGMLLDANTDPATVQAQTGHASLNQVIRYDRRPDARRRAAIAAIEVPYKRSNPVKDKKG